MPCIKDSQVENTYSLQQSKRETMEKPSEIPETHHLDALVNRIEQKHHAFTRSQIDLLENLFVQIRDNIPDQLKQTFLALRNDLIPHLMKEENILFPYITALTQDLGHPPPSCFGSIANPIRMMKLEHDRVKALLDNMRNMTADYRAEAGSGRADLYTALKALDEDLVEHMHQEDDVLFPQALAMESSACHPHPR